MILVKNPTFVGFLIEFIFGHSSPKRPVYDIIQRMLIKKPLFNFSFWVLVLLAGLHHLAIFFFWYWTVGWFDILMHFLGGVWVGSILLSLYFESGWLRYPNFSKIRILLIALVGSLFIGIAWEVFEVLGGIVDIETDLADSILDIVMDTIGGVVAFINALRYKHLR